MRRGLLSALLAGAVALAVPAGAQEALFLIRHAEKAAGDDPALTGAGRARAARWAEMLDEAGIEKVFTSTARRTMETGAIIAGALGVEAEAMAAGETVALLDLIGMDHEDGRVLIVGHTNTIPAILGALGALDPPRIAEDDFARLFIAYPRAEELIILDMRMP